MCDECEARDANRYVGVEKAAQGYTNAVRGAELPAGQLKTGHDDDSMLDHLFSYHPPNPTSGPKYETLREAARHFAKVILMNVPRGADRTAAIRKVREAVMTANAGVACDGVGF